jgi:hypothetical protein
MQPNREWYGKYIIVTDLASVGLFLAGVALLDDTSNLGGGLMLAGLGTYALGGPIVHFSHGQTGRGFASLGLRVGGSVFSAISGGLLGALASAGCDDGWCQLEGIAIGGIIGFTSGILAGSIVDNAVLAYKTAPPPASSWSVIPSYHPVTGQAGLSLRRTW